MRPIDLDTQNALKLFPELKRSTDVTDAHRRIARNALLAQIRRNSTPQSTRKLLATIVHNECVRMRRGA